MFRVQLRGVWLLYAFAAVGLIGSIFIALVARSPADTVKETPPACSEVAAR